MNGLKEAGSLNKKFIFILFATLIFISIFSFLVLAADDAGPEGAKGATGATGSSGTSTLKGIWNWITSSPGQASKETSINQAERVSLINNWIWYWVVTSLLLWLGSILIRSTTVRGFLIKTVTFIFGGPIRSLLLMSAMVSAVVTSTLVDYINNALPNWIIWIPILSRVSWISTALISILNWIGYILLLPALLFIWPFKIFPNQWILASLITVLWILGVPFLICYLKTISKNANRQQKARDIREAEENLKAMGKELRNE